MANQPLQHYLRTYRRRSGLSQAEIGLLLGASSGGKVSRYEHFSRNPSFVVVFAYEVIFDRPARRLFAGAYRSVRQDVQARAWKLIKELEVQPKNPRTTLKLQLLRAIVENKATVQEG